MVNYQNRLELIKSLNPKIGVEVGVMEGQFSRELLTIPSLEKLYLVDLWKHHETTPYKDDGSNVTQGGHDMRERNVRARFASDPRVEVINGCSWEEPAWIGRDDFDFVFIDAAHYYEAVVADLRAWRPLTKHLLSHDYFTKPPVFEVPRAVATFLGDQPHWKVAGVTQEDYPTVHLMRR